MDPQQELFSALRTGLPKLGYGVYDGALPPDGTPYPFIYLSDSQQDDSYTKSQFMGQVNQTIKVWIDSPKKRGTLSKILSEIKSYIYGLHNTTNYAWFVSNLTQRILPDDTVKPPLMQGILEITFRFS